MTKKTSQIDASTERRTPTTMESTSMEDASVTTATGNEGGGVMLLEEADESLAQSLLIFLYADLRLLSATGRIHTKFETLCIDSDFENKTTAASLAATDVSMPSQSHGLSPAQIMAALMLEIRQEIEEHKETLNYMQEGKVQEGLKEEFIFLRDRKSSKFEENMHSLLKAYNDMIRQDRNKDFRGVNAHRHLGAFVEFPNSNDDERAFEEDGRDFYEEDHEDNETSLVQIKSTFEQSQDGEMKEEDDGDSNSEHVETIFMQSARKALLERRKSYLERRKVRQEALRDIVHKQKLALLQGEDAVAHEEFAEMGNSLFVDDRSAQTLSPQQVIDLMEKAVQSRVYGDLNFLADFFKPGTISYLMAKSKARIVWINDWYPIKDLIYALSVDKEKKRVLVVFRGAITQADWHHAYDSERIKVPNPVTDSYKDRKDFLMVHSGFYRYLFRRRKDTGGTTKYDEIANKVHAYGVGMIGHDYKVAITGFSLGAALATLYGLYASTEERFTKNGPVKMFSFGSPMVGGRSFGDSFRHQERAGKLQYARFFNVRDVVSHLPVKNLLPCKSGSRYQHVGIGVKIHRKYLIFSSFQTFLPEIYYVKNEGVLSSYWRALRKNAIINVPWPWKIKIVHSLNEHLRRLNRARKATENHPNHPVNKTLDELYEELVMKRK